MNDISAVALFCSDVREEKGNTVTLVGVLPDKLNVPKLPGGLPKLCVYVRIHVGVNFDPGALYSRLVMDGKEIGRIDVQSKVVDTARAKSKDSGKAYAGLISTFVMAPLAIAKPGLMEALVTARGNEIVAGSLYINEVAQLQPT
jgi:hypothetical protein